jgi:hypothetical protein
MPSAIGRQQPTQAGYLRFHRRGRAGDQVPGSPANAPPSVTCLTISPCCGLARTSVVIG